MAGWDDLSGGVVEVVVDELSGDTDVHLRPTHGWQNSLHRLSHGVRQVALAHSAVFPLSATRPSAAPRVGPPVAQPGVGWSPPSTH